MLTKPNEKARLPLDKSIRSFFIFGIFQDVFVLDPFEGPAFDSLCKFKCTVIGPQTIMSCLSQGV